MIASLLSLGAIAALFAGALGYLAVGLVVAGATAGPDTLDTHPLGVVVAWPAVVVVAAVGIAIMYVASGGEA